MRRLHTDPDIQAYVMGEGEQIWSDAQILPTAFYIFPRGAKDNTPSLAVEHTTGAMGVRIVSQVSLNMLRPVIDELLRLEQEGKSYGEA